MRVPLSWLAEHVDISGIEPGELVERLTLAGLEVEGIRELGAVEGVVVGRVLEASPHPQADRLLVCQVEAGGRVYTVVCGAPNLRVGALVPLALPGARLPAGEVKEARIRGVKSQGMILSQAELGLEQKSAGIWNLPEGPKVGEELTPLLELPDRVLELKVTSNRPDLLGIYGVAREVAALFGLELRELDLDYPEEGPPAEELVQVEVESPEDCPRYLARVILDLEWGPSPARLAARLLKAGMRALSLVVDVTNYVMLELGHPLHAFDYDRLRGGRIGVRRARPGERIRTLDGVERALGGEVLLITDGERPVALAGIMGGEETEVSGDTHRVLLEAACFSPGRIRRSARALGLYTEASLRFERGLAPQLAEVASRRACSLLSRLAPVVIARGAVDAYPRPARLKVVRLRKARVEQVLGMKVPEEGIVSGLSALGLVLREEGEAWEARIPPWRGDLAREIDLIEEVARLHGYEKIPSRAPVVPLRAGEKAPREAFCDRVRRLMAALGLTEIYSLGLVPKDEAEVVLRNPQARGQEGLRASLLPGLLSAVKANLEAQNPGVALFEVGRTFHLRDGGIVEEDRLGVALAGRIPLPLSGKAEYSLAELKGILDGLLSALKVEDIALDKVDDPRLHPYRRAGIYLQSQVESPKSQEPSRVTRHPSRKLIGWLGELVPELCRDLPGERRVLAMELALAPLAEASREAEHRPLPRFPVARRDLSLLAPLSLEEARLREALMAEPLLESCFLYDVYQGRGVPEGHRSLTYELTFRHPDRTLASEEVDEAISRILSRLEVLGVRLRS
ncbi:MAG: Phenylalanine--tRNA ligase beta subunit [Acetothermia bacterium 64_32]|nr:MAG: Phenylalanine--tRNA ligase beta subunit [Acetothermia bacterium 64_32]HAF71559.1 phenylalanine--tRNA ligase subunit beta [Candidatus Acetothermia bacterium]